MNLQQFIDTITPAEGLVGQDGLWRPHKPNVVFDKFREICAASALSYSWTIKAVQFHPLDKRTIVTGTLKVWPVNQDRMKCDDYVEVSGAAIGQTVQNEVAGVTTSANLNALLRGLGMANWAYQSDPQIQNPTVQQPQQQYQQPQQQNYNTPPSRPPAAGNGQFRPRPNGTGGPLPPSNGQSERKQVKQGQWAGTYYDQLPIEVLQGWANSSSPNPAAVKELNRRVGSQPPSVQYQPPGDDGGSFEEEIPF